MSETISGKFPPPNDFVIRSPQASSITIMSNSNPIVTIRPNGEIEYGEGYTPTEAAKFFWDAVGLERKSRV